MSLEQVTPDGLLHTVSAPGTHWGTANLGEAMPGVLTPLGWSIWGPNTELAVRGTFADMGSLEREEIVVHDDPNQRFMSIYYGRVAGNISFLCHMADRLPGTNAEVMAGQMLGAVPADVVPKRDLSRLPAIAKGMPRLMVKVKTIHIEDLWEVGRERMTLAAFLDAHGYHGPMEGEISGRVPAWRRPSAKFILKLGLSRLPIRGVGKAAFLQSLDICRATARRMGALLAEAGTLADPEDVFMFTFDELMAGLGGDAKAVAAERRALRAELQECTIPSAWTGNPTPIRRDETIDQDAELSGIGASGGIVEGTVRVVHDPAFTDVEPDEVVVCATTDPSWASILFLSSALVVDIGGKLSHAAVVAREVGIPCVIDTHNGTKLLNTGDRVRVDGNKGTVEVLSRAAAPDAETVA